MEKQEILEAAFRLEEDGYAFYKEVASQAGNELAKKTFESFATDEQMHMQWIRELMD